MKLGHKRFLEATAVAIFTSMILLVSMVSPAKAWTQEQNLYDYGGTGYCGASPAHPCIYWQEPQNTSITLHALIQSTMWNNPSINFDFRPALTTAFNSWNSAPAWNPYIYACYAPCSYPVAITYDTNFGLPCTEVAETDYTYNHNNVESGYNIPGGGQPGTTIYYSFFTNSGVVWVNGFFNWNYDLNNSGSVCPGDTGYADARTALTHETGHVLGLGHTGHQPSIMYPYSDSLTFYTLQPEDTTAIENIYPGNQPSS